MARLYQERTSLPPQVKWIDAGVGAFFFGFFLVDLWVRHDFNWPFLLLAASSIYFWFVFKSYEDRKGPTSLEVDDRGLTYKHMWMVRHWAWSELSPPEMARGGIDFDSYIRLRPAKPIDWIGRLLLPGLSSRGSEICLRPIFGVPLEEMLQELEACRGQTRLGGEAPEEGDALPA